MSTTINHEQFVLDGNYITAVMKLAGIDTALSANTVLGKKTNDGALSAADAVPDGAGEAGANTGTGTVVLDETTPVLAGAKIGDYTIKCISAATADPAADAVFEVYDPEGSYIGKTDAGTAGDTFSKHIKFVITDKATAGEEKAFAAGDGFIITVSQAAASNELAAWNPTATDGSEVPYAILAADAPASEDEQYVSVYIAGTFNADGVVVPTGVDVDTAFDALREKGIYLIHQADTERNPAVVEE
jgi:hypothetical protein